MIEYDVFVDESGVGSPVGVSTYCLVFVPHIYNGYIDDTICAMEKQIRIPAFHWREHSWKIKRKVITTLIRIKYWSCVILVFDNSHYSVTQFNDLLIQAIRGINIKKMYIDGKKKKQYTYAIKCTFKTMGLTVSTLKHTRHTLHGGLRIADTIAGLSRLVLEGKGSVDAQEYYTILCSKKITTQLLSGSLSNPPHGR